MADVNYTNSTLFKGTVEEINEQVALMAQKLASLEKQYAEIMQENIAMRGVLESLRGETIDNTRAIQKMDATMEDSLKALVDLQKENNGIARENMTANKTSVMMQGMEHGYVEPEKQAETKSAIIHAFDYFHGGNFQQTYEEQVRNARNNEQRAEENDIRNGIGFNVDRSDDLPDHVID